MRLIYTNTDGDTIVVENVKVAHLDRMVSIVEEEHCLKVWTPVGNDPMIEIKYAKTIRGSEQ